SLPPERLVIETDAPYLPPHPYRGKPNRPAYVRLVNAGLAQALGMGEDECATLTTANAERFFGLSA
ncbi:MAG: TatD family hydrolase, partial [Nitrospirae bacterium]|nr:TatD family hydrolase [Fimbriimonadaceae bacterium]